MKQSTLFVETLRENPADAESASHQWLVKAGYLRQLTAGVYSFLPLGVRVLTKLEAHVRREMNRTGAEEILLPIMQPGDLWTQSGRIHDYGEELVRFTDRNGRTTILGPTHEEVITMLARQIIHSHRQLPVTLYQIHTKFRDERRPRAGLLRGREFRMKDAYSFNPDESSLDVTYASMYEAYCRILSSLDLDYVAVEANPGAIGGNGGTHEFMVISDVGEDTFAWCASCGYGANIEVLDTKVNVVGDTSAFQKMPEVDFERGGALCMHCGSALTFKRGIEIGHIFKLGTKYSQVLGATYVDVAGVSRPIVMGCYGIGTSRLMAAVVEQFHDGEGIIWPMQIAPFQVHLVPVNMGNDVQRTVAISMYESLTRAGIDVLLDDRDERAGVKFTDADMLGIPLRVTVGNKAGEEMVEVKVRRTSEVFTMSIGDALQHIRQALASSEVHRN